ARSMGVPLSIRQIEQSFGWFAPNYTRASLTVLADIFRGGFTGAEARKAIGGLLAAGSAYYTGSQLAISSLEGKSIADAWKDVEEGFGIVKDPITDEITWKPTGRLMTLKVGNYNFGVGGFWYGLVRLAGNIDATINEVGERERRDLVKVLKHGRINRDNPFVYWWYTRSSPLTGAGFDLASGKDFLGYPIETPEEYAFYIATRFEPIWAEQGLNWLIPGIARDNEIPEGDLTKVVVPIGEVFGLRTFPDGSWQDFYDKANDLIPNIPEAELDDLQLDALERGNQLKWGTLTNVQKTNLLINSDLLELYRTAQADSMIRNTDAWKAWNARIDEEKEAYYGRGSNTDVDHLGLVQRMRIGEMDTRELREEWSEAGQNYGKGLEDIAAEGREGGPYEEIYDVFEKKEATGDRYGFKDDIALAEYIT
ncbi:hypothetical protein LCGC14_2748380, partial [marine sediment metagenome]